MVTISKWVAYRERAGRGKAMGLVDVVERLEISRLAPTEAPNAFDMAYFEALLNDMVAQDGELGRFDGELHDRTVKNFPSWIVKAFVPIGYKRFKHTIEKCRPRTVAWAQSACCAAKWQGVAAICPSAS